MNKSETVDLLLPDEVVALCLDPRSGAFSAAGHLPVVMSAALLMELVLQDRLDGEGRASFLIKNSTPGGSPIIDMALTQLIEQPKNRFIKHWISDPDGFPSLVNPMMERLQANGLLGRVAKRSILVFSVDHWKWNAPDIYREIFASFTKTSDGYTPCNKREYCFNKLVRACPSIISHITDPSDWEGVSDPRFDSEQEQLNLRLIDNISTILRGSINQAPA